MLRVRTDVKKYLHGDTKGMAHLGEYPKNMADARRTIIALQDRLEMSMTSHAKATAMVEEHVKANAYNYQMTLATMMCQSTQHVALQHKFAEAEERLKFMDANVDENATAMVAMDEENCGLREVISELADDKRALIKTIEIIQSQAE